MHLTEGLALISIIIPVYNTVDFLKRCLDSVCNQTYINLEIICVDDGSTDGSEKIVDDYALTDKRVVVIHQKNLGESAARNTGLLRATGKYIGFLDCDDWIESNMYEDLLQIMEAKDVDIVASGYYNDWIGKSEQAKNAFSVSQEVFGRKELLHYIYERDKYRGFSAFIWNKLYKRELLYQDEQLTLFDTSLKLGGDIYYFAQLANRANRVIYTPYAYYHYFQRPSSTWHSTNIEIRKDMLYAYQKILTMFENEYPQDEIIIWIKRFFAFHASVIAEMDYQQNNGTYLKLSQSIMRKYQSEYEMKNEEYPERIAEYRKILTY